MNGRDDQRRFDFAAALVGLVFVALGVAFLLDALDVWELRAGVVISALVIGLGVAMLAGALPGRSRS